jgi:glycerol-3-phosphate O-acyltransferase
MRMTAALLRVPTLDVQLMPVTILWGRSPKSQDSLIKALFADEWASAGPLRQIVTIFVHGRQTRVSFADPISLRRLIDEETDETVAVRKANRFLRFYFRRTRESAIGPDLSHRRSLIRAMMRSDALQEAIARGIHAPRCDDRGDRGPGAQVRVGDRVGFRPGRACRRLLLERLWRRLYVGVGSTTQTNRPGRAWQGSSICPAIAATSTICCCRIVSSRARTAAHHDRRNLNFPLVGPLLRRGGAFFLRRTFRRTALQRCFASTCTRCWSRDSHCVLHRDGRSLRPDARTEAGCSA